MSQDPYGRGSINLGNLFSRQSTLKHFKLTTGQYAEVGDGSIWIIVNGLITHVTGTGSKLNATKGAVNLWCSAMDTAQASGSFPLIAVPNVANAAVLGASAWPMILLPGERLTFTGHANAVCDFTVIECDQI